MGYYTYDKINEEKIEYFNKFWQAASAIRDVYDVPQGYTFKADVYCIVDEEGNAAEQPEEEKKPYCVSVLRAEIPEKYFNPEDVNFNADIEEYDRVEYFDTQEEADAALSKYESSKMKHKGYLGDLISFEHYFTEAHYSGEILKNQPFSETEKDWRGEGFNEYNCYEVK